MLVRNGVVLPPTAKNHDPSDFWVKYKNVTTANGKSVDLKIRSDRLENAE